MAAKPVKEYFPARKKRLKIKHGYTAVLRASK
jgi:hypothetical protein